MENNKTIQQADTQKDVYAIVTQRIIEQLELGTVPWRKPWSDSGIPRNLLSKKPYRGINLMLLASLGYEQNLFITYNQLKEIGGRVRKDEKACPVVYWNYTNTEQENASETYEEAGAKKRAFLRYYSVFNVAQCEDIPESYIPAMNKVIGSIKSCEDVLSQMPQALAIRHKEQKAYYNPLQDFINMPKKNSFGTAEGYYVTLFHELIHSTGHFNRLNRKGIMEMSEFGADSYSQEELVAEIGACYLQSHCGVTSEFEQSAAYIQGWLHRLKNDKRLIYAAAALAQQAVDFTLGVQHENEEQH